MKYIRIDTGERNAYRDRWNRPNLWPIIVALVVIAAIVIPGVISIRKRRRGRA